LNRRDRRWWFKGVVIHNKGVDGTAGGGGRVMVVVLVGRPWAEESYRSDKSVRRRRIRDSHFIWCAVSSNGGMAFDASPYGSLPNVNGVLLASNMMVLWYFSGACLACCLQHALPRCAHARYAPRHARPRCRAPLCRARAHFTLFTTSFARAFALNALLLPPAPAH